MIYRIRDWSQHYERSDLKKTRNWAWIGMPIKHDGKGFRKLMRRNPDLYGAWVLALQVAAKCPTRGVLADEDGPLTPEDLELKTDMPAARFAEMLTACHEIGWLEVSEDGGTTWDTFNSHPDISGQQPDMSGYIRTTDRTDRQNKQDTLPDESGSGAADAADWFGGETAAGVDEPKPKPKGKRKPKSKAPPAEIPAALDTPKFRAAWDEWRQHRREIKKALTPTTAKQQLKQLAAMGLADAVRSIEASIAGGWSGLFPPKPPPPGEETFDQAADRIARELREKAARGESA